MNERSGGSCGCAKRSQPQALSSAKGAPAAALPAREALWRADGSVLPLTEPEQPSVTGSPVLHTTLNIAGMDCPTEEALIRSTLSGLAGVAALDFNLVQRRLTVTHHAGALDAVLSALESIGLEGTVHGDGKENAAAQAESTPTGRWWPMALAGATATLAEAMSWLNGSDHWIVLALALVSIVSGGLATYKKGWIALRHLNLNINALMSIAVTGAMLIGHWPEAAMVMFLFTLAEAIEAKSLDRARNAIRGLMELAPDTATVRQADGSWVPIPAGAVLLDAVVRVRPGERIALDGVVTSGRSTVNQAPITGESLPVDKAEGDRVFAGTINEAGSFEFLVKSPADDSTLARIIQSIESARGRRAPTQRFVDRFAQIYTPAVFILALLAALLPPLITGQDWLTWLYKALVMLVIACPCALVISTPVTIVSGLAAAARKGILIKGGSYLEAGRKLSVLALDKTGTLTHGKPSLTDVVLLANEARYRQIAASLAARSDHPVSQAIACGLAENAWAVENFSALPGQGIRGQVAGHLYHLGNRSLIASLGIEAAPLDDRLRALEQQGKTVVLLADRQQILAVFAVADTLREESRQAIAALHALGIRTQMLTGDNRHTAEAIAQEVGIGEVRGNLLPDDKLKAIEALIAETAPGQVGMVGDGINDAPALAAAHIGFAMGAIGTDTAIETADVALMDDDLGKIAAFVRLSQNCFAILRQNIALALGIKALFLGFAVAGQATMWMAVFADMGTSLLVVGNGLRLLRK